MATVNGARTLGLVVPHGIIASGAGADLVILERDPEEKIENSKSISTVLKAGEMFATATLLSE